MATLRPGDSQYTTAFIRLIVDANRDTDITFCERFILLPLSEIVAFGSDRQDGKTMLALPKDLLR